MALEQATDLDSYQRAAEQLEAALSKLNTLELNPEQQQTLEKLQQVASYAHEAITQEKLDQERLLRAEQAIDSARGLIGEGRQAQIDAASRNLQPISGAGFAAARARELRIQLALMEADAAEGQGSQTLEAPVRGESLSTPPPMPQAPRPSGTSAGAPLRALPLW
jgi:CHASE3 domain sensor protein